MRPYRRGQCVLPSFVAVLAAAALACAAPGLVTPTIPPAAFETALAGTVAAGQTGTAAAVPPSPTATVTFTTEPSATPSPSATPTPPAPAARLSQNTHCRTGPLAIYELIATVLRGEEVRITGKSAQGDYWWVTAPNGRECYMWGRYAEVSGDVSQIPVFTPPPTPTPAFVWAGTWSVWIDAIAGTMTLTQDGSSVSGDLTVPGEVFTLSGTTSGGGRDLSGKVFDVGTTDVADFSFHMLDSTDQFRGSYTDPDPGVWCGARGGAGMPSPCGWP